MIVLFPLFWIVATSFKPDKDWLAWPPVYWSEEPTMSNYNNVWGAQRACGNAILNPFKNHSQHFVTQRLYRVHINIFICFIWCFQAYGVSRYKVLSETRMFQLLMLRMVPPIVLVGPLSLYYTTIGLIDFSVSYLFYNNPPIISAACSSSIGTSSIKLFVIQTAYGRVVIK